MTDNRPFIMTEDENMLVRCDSLLSLIRYRESTMLSDSTIRELDELLAKLRPRTNELTSTFRERPERTDARVPAVNSYGEIYGIPTFRFTPYTRNGDQYSEPTGFKLCKLCHSLVEAGSLKDHAEWHALLTRVAKGE